VVTLPAWQNARTHGTTLERAVRNGRSVLYGPLAREAEREGVSLNKWIVNRLAG
jgi:hypothetical protein